MLGGRFGVRKRRIVLKKIIRGVIVAIIGLLMSSCINDSVDQLINDESDEVVIAEGSNFTVLGNSRTIIKGAVFGNNQTPALKTVNIFVQNTIEGLYLDTNLKAIKNTHNDGFFIIIEIENKGSENYCFVELENIFYYDKNGNKLNAVADYAFSRGNTGQITTGFTDTCLFSNNKGIILLIEDFYNELSYITCDLSVSDYTKPTKIESIVQGEYYKFENNILDVNFRNSGKNKVDIDSLNFYLLRGVDNIPVGWGYFYSINPSSGIIEVDSTGSISQNIYSLNYQANQVEICFDYDPFLDTSSNKGRIKYSRNTIADSIIELEYQRNMRLKEMEYSYR